MDAKVYELYIDVYLLFRTGNHSGPAEYVERGAPLINKCAAALAVSDARDDEDPASYMELKTSVEALLDSLPEGAV